MPIKKIPSLMFSRQEAGFKPSRESHSCEITLLHAVQESTNVSRTPASDRSARTSI
jgi:hypothetical protein